MPAANQASWLRPFVFAILVCLAVTGFARLGLVLWLGERVRDTGGVGFILLQGLRFDLVSLGYLLAIPAALTPIANSIPALRATWLGAIKWYLVVLVGLFGFMEVVTPPFIQEYDMRPNYLFVEYLKYPKEVVSMLWVGYKPELLAAAVLVPALIWPVLLGLKRQVSQVRPTRPLLGLPFAFAALLLCLMVARSTLDHRPVNASTVAFSSDTLVNSLPLNSLYSTANAIYEKRHEEAGFPYGEVPAADAIAAVRADMHLPPAAFIDSDIPTLHLQADTAWKGPPKNLVILVEESLGAEFVGALGGLPLTPNLDRLRNEGIWFENLYATGTRSARGLEAIVAGFPPSTSQSVLKLGRAQSNFFTIGQYLRRAGYETSFIYGGEAQFDNMRRFFANNGFDTVIDKHDFEHPGFVGSWGVADGDVFARAHAYYQSRPDDHPFLSVLFTTSNHSPWEFPDDKIELYEQPEATVHNAVKYADFAIGEFIKRAKQSAYWNNTVFLIVSDHNSRVFGADLVPIERFHIPGLILGGGIEPQHWDRVASQIDLLPTLLSLIGVHGKHPAPGLDLTRPDINRLPGRAIMQYGDIQAYRQDDLVVIQRRDKPAEMFRFVDGLYQPVSQHTDLLEHAKAVAAWPSIAYREQEYRLP
ncbi:MAG TPA: LTA synthase family protein [Woeseiaceae bacterium]|nr:LTA synthase family protein [Woeseiaceae bacterium]